MIPIQLDLFDNPPTDTEILQKEMKILAERQDNLRKGLFARHAELVKLVLVQQKEIDMLKQALVKK
ncbi:hypothetical protein UFOVP816_21 [uncultured Caudovirales phage]|uniref:Uncharacterized protein n=1 Tax=uncultured Caudovirales phage TaxID=2100421 RepID=A0A6J5P315_9CAUD|nr:hypothetical protein UFOVP816_21 [uncultured Caudovirales phage]